VDAVLFWILAAVAIAAAIVTITQRNPLGSALALAVVLVAVAGLFAMLDAHLLFILQILIYAGAIVVLIIFVIMLLDLDKEQLEEMRIQPVKFAISAVVCAVACFFAIRAIRGIPALAEPVRASFGTVREVSSVMFGTYLIPFEILGLILLVGIVGAVVLAKRGQ
jgi:NADH-quinone oxidoreductase subunit J